MSVRELRTWFGSIFRALQKWNWPRTGPHHCLVWKASEQSYILKHWCPRERQFAYCYIQKDPNLGCNSTQRAESTHPVTTTLLNHQLSLGEAAICLAKGIRTLLKDLDEEESKSYGALPRSLDLRTFSSLTGQVTEYALNRIAADWEACKQAVSAGAHTELAAETTDHTRARRLLNWQQIRRNREVGWPLLK